MRLQNRLDLILGETGDVLRQVDEEAVRKLVGAIVSARRIFVYGQGRTGHMTRAFAVRLMHLGLDVHFVGETVTPPITDADLCLVNSGTGETRFSYHVVLAARKAGARTATITAHPEARIGRLAEIVVVLPAPTRGEGVSPHGARQPAGSLFEQAAFLLMESVVLILMEKLGRNAESLLERHANIE